MKIRRSKHLHQSHSGKSHLFPTGNSFFDRRALYNTADGSVMAEATKASLEEVEIFGSITARLQLLAPSALKAVCLRLATCPLQVCGHQVQG